MGVGRWPWAGSRAGRDIGNNEVEELGVASSRKRRHPNDKWRLVRTDAYFFSSSVLLFDVDWRQSLAS